MANIQPFDYQKSTNIEEHNQIVNKVNEIVEVINNVNLDTINSEIANLKSNAVATDTEIANIKNKDSTQDTEIDGITKSLVSNVTATFDKPSRELKISLGREASPSIDATVVIPASSETGQYSAGNGITIQNYQIAVDTGVVALKTDIPVVPDVSEITNRLDTIDGEITGINADITNLTNKNTEQDTAINGKVAIAQGTENAGKVLGIGTDGNVTPVNAGGSSGGEVWEEIDYNNWPTDWVAGDKVKIIVSGDMSISNSAWASSKPTINGFNEGLTNLSAEFSFILTNYDYTPYTIIKTVVDTTYIGINTIWTIYKASNWNSKSNIITFQLVAFSGAGIEFNTYNKNPNTLTNFVYKMWRLKASA